MDDTMRALFDQWQRREHHQGSVFIEDGMIDSQAWNASPCRILFLLKEARHGGKNGRWDLIQNYVNNPDRNMRKNKTYWPMAHLALGVTKVLCGEGIAPFPRPRPRPRQDQDQDLLDLLAAINSLSIVNLKKSHGKRTSQDHDLARYVARDWDLIDRQIQLLNPDVVICGGTWHLIKGAIMASHPTKLTWNRVYDVGGTPYVNFWHPSYPRNKEMPYYAICGIVARAMANGLLQLPALQRMASTGASPAHPARATDCPMSVTKFTVHHHPAPST